MTCGFWELRVKLCDFARPEVVDRALRRNGRFGNLLYVPLPKPDERGLILNALARKKPVDASLNLFDLGRSSICENFSGADLVELVCFFCFDVPSVLHCFITFVNVYTSIYQLITNFN